MKSSARHFLDKLSSAVCTIDGYQDGSSRDRSVDQVRCELSDVHSEDPNYLGLLESMPVGVAIYDADGILAHANVHYRSLISSTILPSGNPDRWRWCGPSQDGGELPRAEFPCERAFRGETVSPGVDLLHVGDDGTGRWLNVSASPIIDPDRGGAIVGIVLLFLDTNDKTEAAAFAARAAQSFRQFADHSSTAIWIADAGTQLFSYRNSRHAQLVDGSLRTIASLSDWLDHVDDRDRSAVSLRYDRALMGDTAQVAYGLQSFERRAFCNLRETIFPIRDDGGRITMIGGITEDVTPAGDRILYAVGGTGSSAPPLQTMLPPPDVKLKRFGSIRELLDAARFLAAGCVVIDLSATADAEPDLARALADLGSNLPVVLIGTPQTSATTAVAAMRSGAADYLIAPLAPDDLARAVSRAYARLPVAADGTQPMTDAANRFARLSRREREVLAGLKNGGTNKSIGRDLGISPRTVELHRSHLMERMNVRSLAELIQASQ